MLLLNIEHDSRIITVTVVNVYAPNTEKCRFDFSRKVSKWISKYSINDENVILSVTLKHNKSSHD